MSFVLPNLNSVTWMKKKMMIYVDVYRLFLIIPAHGLSFFSHHNDDDDDNVKTTIIVSKDDFLQIKNEISI